MKISVLASSSAANCTYVSSGDTSILIDVGLSCKQACTRLESIGVDPQSIEAVCVTHEHSDHIAGLPVFTKKTGAMLYANSGTMEAVRHRPKYEGLSWQIFQSGSRFKIGDLTIEPFLVPHDAYEPVGFVVDDGQVRVGVVTDMGMSTPVIRDRLASCQVAVVESNYDEDMLKNSERPWQLKQRIMGRQGHLSNNGAGDLVTSISNPDLKRVYLAHLSGDCNRPELAMRSTMDALHRCDIDGLEVELTYPDRETSLLEL